MQITVFGASGKVGRLVVDNLVADKHDVIAFVHRANPFASLAGVTVVQGAVSDRAAVRRALKGSQAVISALGSWGTPNKDVVSIGTTAVIEGMAQQNIRRLITVTGANAFCAQDVPTGLDRATHALLSLMAPKILKDGEAHLRAMEASGLDWTCIRSPIMTGSKRQTYRLRQNLPSLLALIPRRAVARCLIDQLKDSGQFRQAPVICRV